MTDQTSTEVEPYITQGRLVLKESATLEALQSAIIEPYHADTARTEVVAFPEVPKPVVLTDDVKKALRRLPHVFAVVQPETRRTLNDEEMAEVHEEYDVLGKIVDLLSTRKESLKTIVRTHMDVDAEERGVAVPKAVVDEETGKVIVEATDRTKEGHYILCGPQAPERTPIPKTNLEWSREYRKGSVSTHTSPEEMLDLLAEGVIDRDTYLAMTREVRVFDEAKAMSAAVHSPDLRDQIIKAIKAMTSVGKPSVSLFIRKAK